MSKPPKQEKRDLEERLRRKQLPRRESMKPEKEKRRKKLLRRLDELRHRRKLPNLPADKFSNPFLTLSLSILT
jgi:hypothetical protein